MLRRVSFRDLATGTCFVFPSNNSLQPALTIAKLCQGRWTIEVFFEWIEQHRRIRSFLGNSQNAIRPQLWIAVSVDALVQSPKRTSVSRPALALFFRLPAPPSSKDRSPFFGV